MKFERGAADPLGHALVKTAIASAEAALGREGRIVIRPSGTEPVIRVMAEGADPDLVRRSVDGICEAITAAT